MPATSETDALLTSLQAQRAHVLGTVDGLSDADLQRPVLPSGWTCLGLVQHLALDVERFWFRQVIHGEQVSADPPSVKDENAWQVSPGTTATTVLDLYRHESARADEILRESDPDVSPAWWPDFFGDFRLYDVRQVVLHVIAETATHAGHLDAARELIDGRQWMVLG